MLEKFLRMSALLDFYGALLTEKQHRCLELHFLEDLSLSEIGDQLGVSRQAVYDIVHRSEQLLNEYEAKLKLVERYQDEQRSLKGILQEAKELAAERHLEECPAMRQVLVKIENLIGKAGEA